MQRKELKLFVGVSLYRAGASAEALQIVIVEQYSLTVCCQAHIHFDSISAGDCPVKGRHGILRDYIRIAMKAAVSKESVRIRFHNNKSLPWSSVFSSWIV